MCASKPTPFGRALRELPAAIAAALALPALAHAAQWFENFDSYQNGSQMHGQGGWKGWDNDARFGALVTDAQSRSSPHSLDIVGASDLVHVYPDDETGKWTFVAWQYIPGSTTGTSYFILLNRYRDGGTNDYDRWSIQLPFDLARNEVRDDFVQGARLPIVRDQWMEIRVEIDLDTDYREVYYGGQFLSRHTWTRGESGSALDIDAVDLYANNARSVYYDDLSLVPRLVNEPTARNPLPRALFSFDRQSPSVGITFTAADVLRVPGPVIDVPDQNMRLFDANDELDALSFANQEIGESTFVLTFSVDRATAGLVPPDPVLVSLGFPYNVQDQSAKRQAPGDEYMSLTLFDRNGPLAGPTAAVKNNTLVINQGDAGGVDYEALPAISPEDFAEDPNDDVDAGMRFPLVTLVDQPFFFSVSRDSPSLPGLGGTNSGADIYVDFDPNQPGGEQLYLAPAQMGLVQGDDIAALIVFDNGNFVLDPNQDQVLFTLARGSPSLNRNIGPADVLTSKGTGSFRVYATAEDLGLLREDHINMLELARCENIRACVYDWAIGFGCPGDLNGDGLVNLQDLATLLSCYQMDDCGDVDGDGDTDLADLATLLAAYGTSCH
jgi:hypothetical protein